MEKPEILYTLDFSVRDYECDLQGIVNNACYQHYFEHTRHLFIKEMGMDFAAMHRDGIDAVVVRVVLEYKQPLTSGNEFAVTLAVTQKGKLQIIFHQEIIRKPDNALMCTGRFETAILKDSRPIKTGEFYKQLIEPAKT
jgi:acyl-CoA thioester hydrolase